MCDVLVTHVLPQFLTLVQPPTSPPLISYFSTASQPLLTHIPDPKRDTGRAGSSRPSATITYHPRRLRLSVAHPSDGPTIKGDRLARRVSSTHSNRRGSSTHSNAPVARLQRGTPQNVINIPTQNVRRAGYSTTRSRAAPAFIKGGRQIVINIPKKTEATDEYVTFEEAPCRVRPPRSIDRYEQHVN